jgi:hypothetical protein
MAYISKAHAYVKSFFSQNSNRNILNNEDITKRQVDGKLREQLPEGTSPEAYQP